MTEYMDKDERPFDVAEAERVLRMADAANNMMAEIDAHFRAEATNDISKLDPVKVGAMLTIADILNLEEYRNRTTIFIPTIGGRGERSHYNNGDVFINDKKESKIEADFLVCISHTGDCHHSFIPLIIIEKGILTLPAISAYEKFGHPVFVLRDGNLDKIKPKPKPFSTSPDRETILKEIEKQFITAKMHNCDDIYSAQRALHALIVAKALIELLEAHDCGSIGGFDGGNRGIYTLEGRFEFLKNKYKIEDNLPFISW